jgi:hypothetical protein
MYEPPASLYSNSRGSTTTAKRSEFVARGIAHRQSERIGAPTFKQQTNSRSILKVVGKVVTNSTASAVPKNELLVEHELHKSSSTPKLSTKHVTTTEPVPKPPSPIKRDTRASKRVASKQLDPSWVFEYPSDERGSCFCVIS